jgi:hypothetical protein
MARILLVGVDLFLRGKFEALLPDHRFISTEGIDPPDLVIVDIARVDADDVADAYPDAPLLGFTNHTDTDGLRRAHAAGFDQVVVKSALFERPSIDRTARTPVGCRHCDRQACIDVRISPASTPPDRLHHRRGCRDRPEVSRAAARCGRAIFDAPEK